MGSLLQDHNKLKLDFDLDIRALASIKYHSLFSYPLAKHELGKWIAGKKLGWFDFSGEAIVTFQEGYFFLGSGNQVLKRKMREQVSLKKIRLAKKIATFLGKLPTIKLIAITGSLAMLNSDEGSDIDFLIITKKGTLWTTRLIVSFVSILATKDFELSQSL